MFYRVTFFLVFAFFTSSILAQEAEIEVIRTKAVDRSVPVRNVYVDVDDQRWVATTEGIYQVYTTEQGVKQDAVGGKVNILSFPDGNRNLMLSESELNAAVGENTIITTMHFDSKKKHLWVGTSTKGVFLLNVDPSVQKISQLTTENSKLTTNVIRSIFIDPTGKKWIGTDDGALTGEEGKWEHKEAFFHINAFAYHNQEVWVAADDLLWWVDKRGKWSPMELDASMLEGPIIDIEFDSKGRIWIASEILTRFNIENNSYKIYGPSEYFTSQFVNRIYTDADNAVWIATEDKGLYVIQSGDALTLKLDIVQALDCKDESVLAIVKAEIFGGTEPFVYLWEDGAERAVRSDLKSGVYKLKVTDAKGKVKESAIEIPNPKVEATVNIVSPAGPDGAKDGVAELDINGGVPEYTILWDNGNKKKKAENLVGGAHSVKITDSKGCSTEVTFEMEKEILPLRIADVEFIEEIKCFGEQTAQFVINIKGGVEPFTQSFDKNVTQGEKFKAGNYLVTVTDAEGNTASINVEVKEPAQLMTNVEVITPATANNKDGVAEVSVEGGTGSYSYSWSEGTKNKKATNLAAGEYQVSVTDGNGCTVVSTVQITEDILPLTVTIEAESELKCATSEDGKVIANIKGGKTPYKYYWSSDFIKDDIGENLVAGSYALTVTDASNQTASAIFLMKAPDPISIDVQVTNSANTGQKDGKAIANVQGGTGNYTYAWDNGETNDKVSNLGAGDHTIIVTDENGCSDEAQFVVTEDILPLAININQASGLKCANDESAVLNAVVSGGKGPFTFKWDNGSKDESISNIGSGSFLLTVTDVTGTTSTAIFDVESPKPLQVSVQLTSSASTNEKDGKATANVDGGSGKYTYEWDNGETKDKVSNLGAGEHTLLVTDENGCTDESKFVVTEDILPLAVSLKIENELNCTTDLNGVISSVVSGGKSPFEYKWSGDFEFQWNGVETNTNLKEIGAGNYQLLVTDVSGSSAISTITLSAPDSISINVLVTASATTNNTDGAATAKATGGGGKFKYAWDNGDTKENTTSLAPGSHSVTVTDQNGCSKVARFDITEDILPLTVSIDLLDKIKCAGGNSGALSVVVRGGKTPFNYSWDNGMKDQKIEGLDAGIYVVEVTDAAGNKSSAKMDIESPETLSVELEIVSNASANNSDGSIKANVFGGTGTYTYDWSNGSKEEKLSNIPAGEYTLALKDENGCSAASKIKVTEEILPLSVSLEVVQSITCAESVDAQVKAMVKGGKSPFTYKWTGASGDGESVDNVASGKLDIEVVDASGLSANSSINVEAPKPINVILVSQKPSRTEATDDGKATIEVTGGTAPYSFDWGNGEIEKSAKKLPFGNNTVTVTDKNGCVASQNIDIKKKILPDLTAGLLKDGQTIKMETLQFDADSSTIKSSSEPVLNELYEFLLENPLIVVEIGGHTNGLPSHEFCDRLSSARAKEVATEMVAKGISAKRIFYKGYGKRNPIATNQTKEGRIKNQRVEVKILRLEGDG